MLAVSIPQSIKRDPPTKLTASNGELRFKRGYEKQKILALQRRQKGSGILYKLLTGGDANAARCLSALSRPRRRQHYSSMPPHLVTPYVFASQQRHGTAPTMLPYCLNHHIYQPPPQPCASTQPLYHFPSHPLNKMTRVAAEARYLPYRCSTKPLPPYFRPQSLLPYTQPLVTTEDCRSTSSVAPKAIVPTTHPDTVLPQLLAESDDDYACIDSSGSNSTTSPPLLSSQYDDDTSDSTKLFNVLRKSSTSTPSCESQSSTPCESEQQPHVQVRLSKKTLHVVRPRIDEWLRESIDFANTKPAFLVLAPPIRALILQKAWARLLLLYMAENNFSFATTSVVSHSAEAQERDVGVGDADKPTQEFAENVQYFIDASQTINLTHKLYNVLRLNALFSDVDQLLDHMVPMYIRQKVIQILRADLTVTEYDKLMRLQETLFSIDESTVAALFCEDLDINSHILQNISHEQYELEKLDMQR